MMRFPARLHFSKLQKLHHTEHRISLIY